VQIVTDSGTDVNLTEDEKKDLNVHVVPLVVTLDGKTYHEGVDIQPEELYRFLEQKNQLPTTSQPSAGDIAALYRELAKKDADILSIHISSGLSGTFSAAQAAAKMVPEARVTVVDTKTLSAPAGWQVEAAAKAAQAGDPLEKIMALMSRISQQTDVLYTLNELKYLIHGGRISHMKGLLASLLDIKPIIGVEKVNGTYVNVGQSRSFAKAIKGVGDYISRHIPVGDRLRAQVVHAANPEGAQQLRDEVSSRFDCDWLPTRQLSLVLGAHVGRSMVGVCFAEAGVW
jgi:DegV family protein with EDD domain